MMVYKNPREENHYYIVGEDNYPENPRDFDNLGRIYTYNKDYSPDSYDEDFIDVVRYLYDDTHIDKKKHVLRAKDGDKYVVLPVYIYEHGCTYYSTNSFIGRAQHAEWDSGLAGIIFANEKDILSFFGYEELTEEAIKCVLSEFEQECIVYSAYVNGNTYAWYDYTFENDCLELIDSCGGYYDVESIIDELCLGDDYEIFPDEKTFEIELHRRKNVL